MSRIRRALALCAVPALSLALSAILYWNQRTRSLAASAQAAVPADMPDGGSISASGEAPDAETVPDGDTVPVSPKTVPDTDNVSASGTVSDHDAVSGADAVPASAADWGLSFQTEGAAPVGNAAKEELAQYDAWYLGDTSRKVLYLTFDCGYENGYTEQILDALKKHNAPAAFFVVGHMVQSAPNIVRRMGE